MSTKEEPGPFDGLERAEPDEPVFTLRAKDDLAPGLVRDWIEKRRLAIFKDNTLDDRARKVELLQCNEADDIAIAMDDWRAGRTELTEAEKEEQVEQRTGKPDGVPMSAQQLAVKAQFDARRKAGEVLANVISELVDVSDMLAPYDFADDRDLIGTLGRLLGETRYRIKPKRASYAHLAPEGQQII